MESRVSEERWVGARLRTDLEVRWQDPVTERTLLVRVLHLDVEERSEELLAPALLCHKEPARRIQSHLLGALERKIPLGRYFACSSLVLYGIRELA